LYDQSISKFKLQKFDEKNGKKKKKNEVVNVDFNLKVQKNAAKDLQK